MIIKYKIFNSTEQLEEWQKEEIRTIISINPVPLSMDMGATETEGDNYGYKDISGNIGANFGVMVIYREGAE
jgi:hypothetical protein